MESRSLFHLVVAHTICVSCHTKDKQRHTSEISRLVYNSGNRSKLEDLWFRKAYMHVNDGCTTLAMDQDASDTYIAAPIPPRYLAPSKGPR